MEITFGPGAVLLYASAIVPGLAIALLYKNRVSGLGMAAQLRAASYLTRFSMALEYYGLRGREVRSNVDALRSDLAESAAHAGLVAALQRLGPPRTLAANIAGGRLAPSWLRGTLWLAMLAALGLFATAAFVAGFETAADAGQSATWSGPFRSSIQLTADQAGRVSAAELSLPAALPVAIIVFLVGARAWRLFTARRRSN